MTRIVAVILFAASLATVSTGTAQAQQWEYASFFITQSDYTFMGSGMTFQDGVEDIADLYDALILLYGEYAGRSAYEGTRYYSRPLTVLNILGDAGWELVAVAGDGSYGLEYYLKRPLPN